ncbi:DsbA family protein [Candidatus Peregrinibacteria bacterium]|nr:DsbA family protein [Candidatus Peregrinibacteria bacterium]
MSDNNNNALVFSIIFAAVAISGSMIFFGLQMSGKLSSNDLQTQITDGINNFIAKQQEDQQKAEEERNKPRQVPDDDYADDDAFLGEEDAPVVMVEFSDYQCPYCAAFHRDTFPQLKKTYIDTGKVKFVYRDLPLKGHPEAYPAALFAECARDQGGDDVYFKVHDKLFETLSQGGFDFDAMSEFTTGLGLSSAKIKTCFDEDKFKEEIAKDNAAADKLEISGTPGFVINNWMITGARPFDFFASMIEAELKKTE